MLADVMRPAAEGLETHVSMLPADFMQFFLKAQLLRQS